MILTTLVFTSVIVCLFIFKKFGFWERRNFGSPPEVPGSLPLIGHLVYLGRQPATILMKWAKTYGKMFFINLGPLK